MCWVKGEGIDSQFSGPWIGISADNGISKIADNPAWLRARCMKATVSKHDTALASQVFKMMRDDVRTPRNIQLPTFTTVIGDTNYFS